MLAYLLTVSSELFEFFWACLPSFSDDIYKIMRQDKRLTFPLDTKLLLEMSKNVTKVNMEQLTILHHHDVIRVTVSNTQNISGYTITSTGECELMDRFIKKSVSGVVIFQPSWKQISNITNWFKAYIFPDFPERLYTRNY